MNNFLDKQLNPFIAFWKFQSQNYPIRESFPLDNNYLYINNQSKMLYTKNNYPRYKYKSFN